MNLSHWSNEPHLPVIESRKQYRSRYGPFQKPNGFWVSVDGEDDWYNWARSNDFRLGQYRHRVYLTPDANVLQLATVEELAKFQETYGRECPGFRSPLIAIDWAEVAGKYQGLVIAPYQWEFRMVDWYYPWDCASGCLWDASAIRAVEPLQEAA